MKSLRKMLYPLLAAFALAVLLIGAVPAEAAKAPVGRTYFVVSIGIATDAQEAYELDVGCMRFTATEMCSGELGEVDCGQWWISDGRRARREMAVQFQFRLIDDETGSPVDVAGHGRIDTRGPKSSIGGVAHGVDVETGVQINFSFAGRAVSPARCEQLAAQFRARLDE